MGLHQALFVRVLLNETIKRALYNRQLPRSLQTLFCQLLYSCMFLVSIFYLTV
jgi:hypothetical protein